MRVSVGVERAQKPTQIARSLVRYSPLSLVSASPANLALLSSLSESIFLLLLQIANINLNN